ncbi:MAG: phosphopyruvate hydratase, partial [Candidatus Berkelbacteria bacterium]|nr:phosphopyruvate hydratase [Candidatus Berkelbacteria bacterium]
MPKITDLRAREILDSRGIPTVACEIMLDDNTYAVGFVPSGASKGAEEALELRDCDNNRFGGKGVLKAVSNVNSLIRDQIIGLDADNLTIIDQKMIELDGTANKSKLGANATLSVSLAAAKAVAKSRRQPLYTYLAEIMNVKLE